MDIYRSYTSLHSQHYVNSLLCEKLTHAPLDHFLDIFQGTINLIIFKDDCMCIEQTSASCIALVPLALPPHMADEFLSVYTNSMQYDIETEMLPWVCNAQTIRSVLYLPSTLDAPVGYRLTLPNTTVTCFGTSLNGKLHEWERRFVLQDNGTVIDEEAELENMTVNVRTPSVHPDPSAVLNQWFVTSPNTRARIR